jgi:WD40 repeat protein
MTGSSHSPPDQALETNNPYAGLKAFSEQDSQFFHGRERETEALYRAVRGSTVTVLFGASGLGKTSLMAAGLFPRLRRQLFFPVLVRVGYDGGSLGAQLRERLSEEAKRHGVKAPLWPGGQTMWEYFHRAKFWNRRTRLLTPVLVLDQFEEAFTLGRDRADTDELLEELGDLIENRIPASLQEAMALGDGDIPAGFERQDYRVLLALREDFLPELQELQERIPALALTRVRLTRMNGSQAREAVLRPASDIVSEEVAEGIVRFVAHAGDRGEGGPNAVALDPERMEVEPALLSLFCRELNELRRQARSPTISADLLDRQGERIIEGFYERCVSDEHRAVRSFIEDRLITASGHRTAQALEDAVGTPGVTAASIERLVDRRLLRREDRLGIPHVELIHDRLTDVVLESRQRRLAREEQRRRTARARLLGGVGVLALLVSLGVFKVAADLRRQAEEVRAFSILTQAPTIDDPLTAALLLREVAEMPSERVVDPVGAVRAARAALGPWYWPQSILVGHDNEVRDVAFSHDGTRILTASFDGTARIWNADGSGEPIVLAEHVDAVRTARFSPDGSSVLTASLDGSVRLWDADGFILDTLAGAAGLPGVGVLDVKFGPRGRLAAVAFDDGKAAVWDMVADSTRLFIPRPFTRGNTWGVAFDAEGRRVATASAARGNGSWIYDLAGADPVRLEHPQGVFAVAFGPRGGFLATASADGHARLWNLDGSLERQFAPPHAGSARAISFDGAGERIVTASVDRTARIWRVDGQDSRVLAGHTGSVWTAKFSPDGRWILTTSDDHTAALWDTSDSTSTSYLRGHRARVRAGAFSPDGSLIVTGSSDGSARVWRRQARPLVDRESRFLTVAMSPDGQLVGAGADDGTVRVWPIEGGDPRTSTQHGARVLRVRFGPSGQRLVSVSRDSTARILEMDDPEAMVILPHRAVVLDAFLAHDDSTALTLSADSIARLWGPNHPDTGRVLEGSGRIAAVALRGERVFSATGRSVAVSNLDGVVEVVLQGGFETDPDVRSRRDSALVLVGGRDGIPGGHLGPIESLHANRVGSHVVTVSSDNTARVWRVDTPSEPLLVIEGRRDGHRMGFARAPGEPASDTVFPIPGHRAPILAASFSPDGQTLLTASADSTARLWDLERGRAVRVLRGDAPMMSAEFSLDGRRILTSDSNGTIRVWDASRPGAPVDITDGAVGPGNAALSLDGSILASASREGRARLSWVSWHFYRELLRESVQACLSAEDRVRYLAESNRTARREEEDCRRRLRDGGLD